MAEVAKRPRGPRRKRMVFGSETMEVADGKANKARSKGRGKRRAEGGGGNGRNAVGPSTPPRFVNAKKNNVAHTNESERPKGVQDP